MFTAMMARCSYLDGLELLEGALESARTVGDRRSEGHLADRIGSIHVVLGRSEDQLAWFTHAADLLHEVGDPVGESAALGNLGATLAEDGRLVESERCLKRALRLARGRDRHETSRALNHLALTYLAMERSQDAVEAASEAVRIRRVAGDRFEAFALDTLGSALIAAGIYQEAVEQLRRAVELQRELDRRSLTIALRNLGRAQRGLGELGAARASWREALQIYDDLRGVHSPGISRAGIVQLIESLP